MVPESLNGKKLIKNNKQKDKKNSNAYSIPPSGSS